MSNLLSNIYRASAPLQESSQQMGMRARKFLVSMSSADIGSQDAQHTLAAAPDATTSSTTGASVTDSAAGDSSNPSSNKLPPSPRGEGDNGGGETAEQALRDNRSSSDAAGGDTATELGDPSLHDAINVSATAAPVAAVGAAAAAASAKVEPLGSKHGEHRSSSSLMHASSPSVHSASSSRHDRASSFSAHGNIPAHPASGGGSLAPAPAAGSGAPIMSPSSTRKPPSPAAAPRTPSPERPVAWRGLGTEEDSDRLVVCESRALAHLFTHMRNRDTPTQSFNFFARRMMRILAEEGIACLQSSRPFITTPTGATFSSVFINERNVCIVSILRAGDALAEAAQACIPHAPVGKILIQRDEESKSKHPVLFYKKLPPKIATMQVLLCDPMVATGGSAVMAIRTLVDAGVEASAIVFVTVIVAPEGLGAVRGEFPDVTVVTGAIDDCLDERRFIVPGLGDFGDRFFGTVP